LNADQPILGDAEYDLKLAVCHSLEVIVAGWRDDRPYMQPARNAAH